MKFTVIFHFSYLQMETNLLTTEGIITIFLNNLRVTYSARSPLICFRNHFLNFRSEKKRELS